MAWKCFSDGLSEIAFLGYPVKAFSNDSQMVKDENECQSKKAEKKK
jgi:hypothetical protein